jgi:hypothetical protein
VGVGYGKGGVDFDAEIPNSALDFCLEADLFANRTIIEVDFRAE